MITTDQLNQLRDLLPAANTILILTTAQPTLDQAAAATSLYLALQAAGKQPLLLSPQVTEGGVWSSLAGKENVQTQLGNKDLSISFQYQPEAVDKVSYHIDEQSQRFYLVIKPQKGQRPLDSNTIQFEYTGAEADLIFLIGVHTFESLEHLYFGYEQLYQDATTVTLHTFEPEIGSIKLNASGASSLSESLVFLFRGLELPLSAEAATNLLAAIEEVTDGFRSLSVTADTFETVSFLMRSGARRARRASTASTFAGVLQGGRQQAKPQEVALEAEPMARPSLEGRTNGQRKKNLNAANKKGDLSYQPGESSIGGRG
jgi:hypothetical protein